MANLLLWDTALTSEGTVLTTELDVLLDGTWSAAGSVYDNSVDLRQYFLVKLAVDFVLAPTTGGYVAVYAIPAADGTNYDTIDSDNDPRLPVAQMEVIDTTAAQIRHSQFFTLPPVKVKFILKNATGQAFPVSGSTLTLYSAADEAQ